ncbi:MAG: DUF3786 domain-containing protein [Desulfobulbaceae bacterium]|nr:DUF3786 domain-containing protein [Desulfobulbaceae bacterium]
MARATTPLVIYKLLPGSNCRECHLASCLAFATAVVRGERRLADCPYVDRAVAAGHGGAESRPSLELNMAEVFARLQGEIASLDLSSRAAAVGGRMEGGRLAIRVLGKDFWVHGDGTVTSSCHINPWVTIPLLRYVLASPGDEPAGEWVAMRELADGPAWSPLFARRCEEVLKRIADLHSRLFEDLVGIFSGRQVPGRFDADIAVILAPLPRVELLVCYWQPEEDLESRLNIFFDRTADRHLTVELLHTLGVGLVTMFGKIMASHTASY